MANTSITLGEHWENFIKRQVSSGRYGSASEVIRDALRVLELKEMKVSALRVQLAEELVVTPAEKQFNGNKFSFDALLQELDRA